ncbi:hypothetical protein BOX15_Mlig000693g1, partial [Macrostomum lignano]
SSSSAPIHYAMDNANPVVYARTTERPITPGMLNEDLADQFDAREVFDLIRVINDPEHPLTLEELGVVSEAAVQVDDPANQISIEFTPTIPHCSQATLIGLSIRVKLIRSLPSRFKVGVRIAPGTHNSEEAINKQLADKERVAAALENTHLLAVVNQCLGEMREH